MADYIVKAHDLYPALQVTLTDTNGAIDLTNATSVKIIMKGQTNNTVITGACTFVDRVNGKVQYSWAVGDLSQVDTYNVEFEITWAGGLPQTVPNDAYKTILVEQDLENA